MAVPEICYLVTLLNSKSLTNTNCIFPSSFEVAIDVVSVRSKKRSAQHHVGYSAELVALSCSVKRLNTATLLKKRLRHRCFPVNYLKFLRTLLFFKNTSRDCF